MRLHLGHQTLAAAVMVALLAGCGGGMSPAQLGATDQNTVAQLRHMGRAGAARPFQLAGANAARSWMAPDARRSTSLLYVADQGANDVDVYSYPRGELKGTLTGFQTPSGVCSNKAGDVFILNGNGTTVEVYKHGGSAPIRTLNLPGYPELNCSVDPTTGNLALGVLGGTCGDCFVVFPAGSGTATVYTPSGQTGLPGCGYDNTGNLFCDAYGNGDAFTLFELPKGSSTVKTVPVSGAGGLTAASIQWDGTDLAFGAGAGPTLYQIRLSGSTGSVVGSTSLSGAAAVWQFWITKKPKGGLRVIAPTFINSVPTAGYWNYPAGGTATKMITNGLTQPDGAALSTKR
ncbi:MAG TPA: hypothetical protein VMT95_07775 [Candidatus Binatia bacterium]|nr:hypothetical protein [Candidatus Binatia bacterium]